jgi:hypothetical protein
LNEEVHEDYDHPDLKFSSGRSMQFDIYVPSKKLVFEYQGEQHYYDSYNIGPQWSYQQRDEEKRLACQKSGITLIEIPYWWDFKKESLIATIHQYRQDLFSTPGSGIAIPQEPLDGFPTSKVIKSYIN